MISWERLSEIATSVLHEIIRYDSNIAAELILDELDMTDEELDYFGINKTDYGLEEDDEDK